MRGSLGTTAKTVNALSKHRLDKYEIQSAARHLLPLERVAHCLHTPSKSSHNAIQILKAKERFHYGNLQTCGSVWHCPICATKISEHRRRELVQAVTNWKSSSPAAEVYLLTLTAPHYQHQHIKPVLNGITSALKHFFNSRSVKTIAKSINLVGRIRSLEITYGENGWHPHFHILLFVKSPIEITNIQQQLLELWKISCVKSGLPEPNHHGLKLDNGEMAAQYVGKWGLEHELTKGHIKQSRGGYSPFDLLRVLVGSYTGGSLLSLDQDQASLLFRDYAINFKAKRQLVWSDGLRRQLLPDLDELTDQDIADHIDQGAELFALINLELWRIIRSRNLRGQVLEACYHGKSSLDTYLSTISEPIVTITLDTKNPL